MQDWRDTRPDLCLTVQVLPRDSPFSGSTDSQGETCAHLSNHVHRSMTKDNSLKD